MAFVVQDEIKFRAKVTIHEPTEKGGRATNQVTGIFRVLATSDVKRISKEIDARIANGEPVADVETEYLREALIGWEGIVTPDKAEFAFTDENRDRLLDIPYVRAGFWKSYRDAISGGARQGN